MVILDNVWETPAGSPVKSWTDMLSKITEFPGSAIIMTTRFSCLAQSPGCNCVAIGRLELETEGSADWCIAENLNDAFLNETAEKEACDGYKDNRKKALRLSCGIPLGITTFAGLVQRYSKTGEDVGYVVLALIEKKASCLANKSVGEAKKSITGHDGLYAAITESLGYLDEREGKTFSEESVPFPGDQGIVESDSLVFRASYAAFPDKFFSARYAALKVMSVSTSRISFEVLCRLWHVATVADAQEIAMAF